MFRLKSLYIKDYKNIKEQTFDFSTNTGYIALIGLNGSGKSNLLEAISLIFQGLFDKKEIPFDYEIKYEMDGHLYERKKRSAIKDAQRVKDEQMRYPTSVIACYSGEASRLWDTAYEDYYMHYFKGAIRNQSFSPQLMYINKYCWKIAFLSLLCSSKDIVKEFLKNTLHINDITRISVHFESDVAKREMFSDHKACKWFDTINQLQNEDPQDVVNANVLASTDMMTYGASTAQAPDYVFQFLFLLALPEKDADKGQTVDKLITNISITIDGVNFDNLSEGEKKMILIECITQVLGNDDSLVLLDEPDAHVHVEHKKELLEETIIPFNGQIVLTTHSPVICNLIPEPQNIKLLKDGVWVDTSKLEQLKRLSGNEMQYFDGAFVLSSKNILVTEGIYDIRYLRKAIEIFARRNPKYEKLKEVGVLYAGSGSEECIIYNELLKEKLDNLEHVVFLFDYDTGGMEGWNKVKPIVDSEPKVVSLFYQHDYTITLDVSKTSIDQQNSILVEDLFDEAAYASLFINPSIMSATYKYFRCRREILTRIKNYIQNNYATFNDIFYDKYQPLLDKLMEVFDLN